jgi:hypothetical protein
MMNEVVVAPYLPKHADLVGLITTIPSAGDR